MADEPRGREDRLGRRPKAKAAASADVEGAEDHNQGRERSAAVPDSGAADITRVPVVGIGASAGGCAFVVVLHLDPSRESEMAHILSTRTSMPVFQVEDGMRLARNHVYVIAPDSDLRVRDGGLHMSKPAELVASVIRSMCCSGR